MCSSDLIKCFWEQPKIYCQRYHNKNLIGGVQTLNDFIICRWIGHDWLLSANTEHIYCPNTAFLNPFGWFWNVFVWNSNNSLLWRRYILLMGLGFNCTSMDWNETLNRIAFRTRKDTLGIYLAHLRFGISFWGLVHTRYRCLFLHWYTPGISLLSLVMTRHLQVAQVILRNIEEYWKWLVILMNIDTYWIGKAQFWGVGILSNIE